MVADVDWEVEEDEAADGGFSLCGDCALVENCDAAEVLRVKRRAL